MGPFLTSFDKYIENREKIDTTLVVMKKHKKLKDK